MNRYFIGALCTIVFIVGIGVGYAFTPEYAFWRVSEASGMKTLGDSDSFIDLRYIDMMIAHHLSAIDLMNQALKQSQRPEILALARTVIQEDTEGIATLYAYKKKFYANTRNVTNYTAIRLGEGDDLFDLRFLNALILHHDEAIASAKEILTKSSRTEILTLANDVLLTLSGNRKQLELWRQEWYQVGVL